MPIPVAVGAVRYPWGEPIFAQPPGKGQMRRQQLLFTTVPVVWTGSGEE